MNIRISKVLKTFKAYSIVIFLVSCLTFLGTTFFPVVHASGTPTATPTPTITILPTASATPLPISSPTTDVYSTDNFQVPPKAFYYSLPTDYNMQSCEKVVQNGASDILNHDFRVYACATSNAASSGRNTDLPCDKDWETAWAETIDVNNFPLLNFLSATQPTQDNQIMPICYRDINSNISVGFKNYVPANFSNSYAGLLEFTGGPGVVDISFPRLGTAVACSVAAFNDLQKPLKLDIQSFDTQLPKEGNIGTTATGGTVLDNIISTVMNWIKDAYYFTTSLQQNSSTQIDTVQSDLQAFGVSGRSQVCDTVAGYPITSLNKSDPLTPDTDNSQIRFVVNQNQEEKQFTHTELCDLNYDTPYTVYGATCTMTTGEYFNKPVGTPLLGNWPGMYWYTVTSGNPPVTQTLCHPAVICGITYNCTGTYDEAYRACRGAGETVTVAGGTPYYTMSSQGYDSLTIPGANELLNDLVNYNEQLGAFYGVQYGEDIGIKLDSTRELFDLNSKVLPYTPDKTPAADYDPTQVNTNLPNEISYTKIPYNYNYLNSYTFTSAGKVKSEFFFPYLGKIPYIIQRMSIDFTDPSFKETTCSINKNCKDALNGAATDSLFNWNPIVPTHVMDIELNMCSSLTSDQMKIQDCLVPRTTLRADIDPIQTYLCQQKIQTICPSNCDSDGSTDNSINLPPTNVDLAGLISPLEVLYPTQCYGPNMVGANVDTTSILYQECKTKYQSKWVVESFHTGVDAGEISPGMKEYAAGPGTVVYAGWTTIGFGNTVYIQHTASDGKHIYTRYGHMLETPLVKVGQTVDANTQVGIMGSTGNSTGPHLHFEIDTVECLQCVTGNIDPTDVMLRIEKRPVNLNTTPTPVPSITPTVTGSVTPTVSPTTTPAPTSPPSNVYCGNNNDTTTGSYNGGNILCLFKLASDAANKSTPQISPEIIWAIGMNESGVICWKDEADFLAHKVTACTGDANQLALVDANPIALAEGVDVRGLTEWSSGTFNELIKAQKSLMTACIQELGVTEPPAADAVDPLSADPAFTRLRVGDAICATTILMGGYGKVENNGTYVTPPQWLQLNDNEIGYNALMYAAGRYQGACSGNYCTKAVTFARQALAQNLFTNLNCSLNGAPATSPTTTPSPT